MPKRVVEYHRLAESESERNFRWYAERSVGAAAGYLAAIQDAVNRIAESAESFPMESHGMRWAKLRDYPYLVHFMIVDDRLCRIYAVPHGRRRPGFWLRRLRQP